MSRFWDPCSRRRITLQTCKSTARRGRGATGTAISFPSATWASRPPTAFGQVSNLITLSSNYGKQTEVYDGIDATINARFGKGGVLSGGFSTGRTVNDNCFQNNDPSLVAQFPPGVTNASTPPRTQA